MTSAGGPYKVPRQNDGWRAVTLAAAMHAGLLAFLWVGVRWQSNEPVAVEAEVWDMKVQSAAPPAPPAPPEPEAEAEPEPEPAQPVAPPAPPVEAPPTPKEPDIALERQKAKLKAEREKQEELKKEKLKKEAEEKQAKLKKEAEEKQAKLKQEAEDKKRQEEKDKREKKEKADKAAKEKAAKAAEQAAKDKAFKAQMNYINGQVGKGTSGTAERSTGPRSDGSYEAAIRSKIKSNLVYGTADDTLSATFRIAQLPSGEILSVRKIKSSGVAAYDNAIENAINKSSPLPRKKDGTVEREFVADFNMKDMH